MNYWLLYTAYNHIQLGWRYCTEQHISHKQRDMTTMYRWQLLLQCCWFSIKMSIYHNNVATFQITWVSWCCAPNKTKAFHLIQYVHIIELLQYTFNFVSCWLHSQTDDLAKFAADLQGMRLDPSGRSEQRPFVMKGLTSHLTHYRPLWRQFYRPDDSSYPTNSVRAEARCWTSPSRVVNNICI